MLLDTQKNKFRKVRRELIQKVVRSRKDRMQSADYKYTGELNALCGDSGKWVHVFRGKAARTVGQTALRRTARTPQVMPLGKVAGTPQVSLLGRVAGTLPVSPLGRGCGNTTGVTTREGGRNAAGVATWEGGGNIADVATREGGGNATGVANREGGGNAAGNTGRSVPRNQQGHSHHPADSRGRPHHPAGLRSLFLTEGAAPGLIPFHWAPSPQTPPREDAQPLCFPVNYFQTHWSQRALVA